MRSTRLLLTCAALLATLTLGASQAQAYSTYKTTSQTSAGQKMTFSFTGLPAVSSGSVYVWVDLYGDYDAATEYAAVKIDGVTQANHNGSSFFFNYTASS